jgi:hypothetical protein
MNWIKTEHLLTVLIATPFELPKLELTVYWLLALLHAQGLLSERSQWKVEKNAKWSARGITYGRKLGFLDRSSYFSFK